jgi:hypothetical protein
MADQNEQIDRRVQFLIHMYDQMWNNINRHLTVVWQSVALVGGAFAIFSLTEKGIVSFDLAIAIIVGISAWLVGHTYDAHTWFTRNLAIIANIERQFLRPEDEKHIHYHFKEHHPPSRLIAHLALQRAFGIGVASLVLIYHFIERVLPGVGQPWCSFDPKCTLPYLTFLVCLVLVTIFRRKQIQTLEEFYRRSPGMSVEDQNQQPTG